MPSQNWNNSPNLRISDVPPLNQHYSYLALLLFSFVSLHAQETLFKSITTQDGLSQNSVVDLIQDTDGFIWMATQDGLNQYTGQSFKKYDCFFRDETKKNYSRLGNLFLDESSRIWATTIDGSIKVIDYHNNTEFEISSIPDASSVAQKDKHSYIIGSYTKGLYELAFKESDTIVNNILENKTIYNLVMLDDKIHACTDDGIFVYHPNGNIDNKNFEFFSKKKVGDIVQDKKGSIYISCFSKGLFTRSNGNKYELVNDLRPGLRIQDIHIDKRNQLWIATYGEGLYKISDSGIDNYKYSPILQDGIGYDDILSICESTNGDLWFGTDGGGVSCLPIKADPINKLYNKLFDGKVEVDVPRAISVDENKNLWIGTSGKGLIRIDAQNLDYQEYNNKASGRYNIPDNRIMSLYHTTGNRLWVGTQDHGLFFIDPEGNPQYLLNNLIAKTIWNLTPVGDDKLMISTRNNGIILLDLQSYEWEILELPYSLKNVKVCIPSPDQNIFFIGTDEGKVLKLSLNEKQFELLDINDHGVGGIKSLAIDDDELLIGTTRRGLVIYHLEKGTLDHFSTKDLLPNNVIYSILPDGDKYFWLSTNNGLVQLSKDVEILRDPNYVPLQLNTDSGILNNEFNTGASYIDKDGQLYFGNIDGVIWFDPTEISVETELQPLVLTQLVAEKSSKEVKTYPIYNRKEVVLDPLYDDFTLSFSTPQFDEINPLQYKYRLVGFDEEWKNSGRNNEVSFYNIPPGHYTIEVLSGQANRYRDLDKKELKVHLKSTLLQNNYFLSFITAILCGLIVLFYKSRIKSLKDSAQLKLNIRKAQMAALQAQVNPHFIFNCLNSIDSYILSNETQKASEYLVEFSRLIRRILELSSSLRISLKEEINVLKLFLSMEKMRFGDKVSYQVNVSEDLDIDAIKLPPLIIQPYVENSIWHGLGHREEGGSITIDIYTKEEDIFIEVIDDGIGRKKSEEYQKSKIKSNKSFGTSVTMKRLKLLNQIPGTSATVYTDDVMDSHGQVAGTKVTIQLPINR